VDRTRTAQFRHFLQLRRLSPSGDELHQFLERARQAYRAGENHLYLCAAQSCCGQSELGTPPADGRFIALRMDASYPLGDGRKDVHKRWSSSARNPCPAPSSPMLTPTAVSCVKIAWSRASEFADEPPGHRERWKLARKILQPTVGGFEERLKVDESSGYVTYYVVTMQKVDAALQA
jgi:hypothetical protein